MADFPINLVDVTVIAILAISGIFALVRGLVHELLAVGSWIGAAIATLYFFPRAQPVVRELITVPLVADIVAGVAIFLVVLIVLSIITHLIARRVRRSHLGALDRSLGMVFGLLRGAVLVCLAWLALSWTVPRDDYPTWLLEARSLPLIERGALALIDLVPPHLRPKGGFQGMSPSSLGGASIFDTLINPTPKDAGPEEQPGYKDNQRQDMQQLIETQQ
jgi:membrane protein required for colicin V production